MHYSFPRHIRKLVDQNMASGSYASEDELLIAALQALREHRRFLTEYRLEDLLQSCKQNHLHGETDWGEDVGREVLD